MRLREAYEALEAVISKLEDMSRRDPVRLVPSKDKDMSALLTKARRFREHFTPHVLIDYGPIAGEGEVECVNLLTTYTASLSDCAAYFNDYLTDPEFDVEYDTMMDSMTTEQIERLNRLQRALTIVLQKNVAYGNKEVLNVIAALQMAMHNDPDAPADTLAADTLLILGVTH